MFLPSNKGAAALEEVEKSQKALDSLSAGFEVIMYHRFSFEGKTVNINTLKSLT